MYSKAVLILFLCSTVFCDILFIQLLGYALIADPGDVYNTTSPQECAEACYADGCIMLRMIWGTGQCQFYNSLFAAVYDADECGYYVMNNPVQTNVQGRNLTAPIDQLVQNIVYNDYYECPTYWDINSNKKRCTYKITEPMCNQYAPFLQVSWNATDARCHVPYFSSVLTCPGDYLYKEMWKTNYWYCYYYLDKWTPSGSVDLYTQANNYCNSQVDGRLPDILSDDENAYIASLLSENETLIIGLFSTTGAVSTVSNLRWNSGQPIDYTNFISGATPTPTDSFKLTVINAAGQWDTAATTMNFKGLVCKRDITNSLVTV